MLTEHYPAQVFWSVEDQAYVAVAPDLPGSSALGDTQAAALAELQIVIGGWIDAQSAVGNPIPPPSPPTTEADCSGRILLRLPRSLHARLIRDAKAEGVSLNSHIMALLAAASGSRAPLVSTENLAVAAPRSRRA